jgi:hypothetical protein
LWDKGDRPEKVRKNLGNIRGNKKRTKNRNKSLNGEVLRGRESVNLVSFCKKIIEIRKNVEKVVKFAKKSLCGKIFKKKTTHKTGWL